MTLPGFDGAGDGWITSPADPRLVVLWPGSVDYGDDLAFPLWCAQVQCATFAPALADPATVPDHYVAAQVMQCRGLVRAGIVGDGDKITGGDESVVVFPMDWTVKALLRPRRGMPYWGTSRPAAVVVTP